MLRSSVFQDCAKVLISWASLLSEYRVDRLKSQKLFAIKLYQTDKKTPFYNNPYRFRHFVLLPSLYIYWLSEANEYKAAAETEMPIGPDAGKLFGNLDGPQRRRKHTAVSRRQTTTLNKQFVGKRGVRRLQQWLQPEDVITQTLADIYVILYPRQQSKERLQQAKQAPHPYWTNKKRKQRITAVRPSQYREAKPGTRVPLGSLSREQIVSLRNQLQEQIRYKAQLAVVQTKITRFLEDAPPTYPSIAPMRPDPKYLRSLPLEVVAPLQADYDRWLTNYHRVLQRTQDFRPMRGDPLGNYTDEHLFDIYALTAQELEQAAAQIEETDGQPIWYSRTMGVKYDPKAFALLKYEQPKESGSRPRYILACEFSGEEAPEKYLLRQTEPPQQQEKRIMVNHPLREYVQQRMSPNTMYFGMEMGAKHQIRKLRDVI